MIWECHRITKTVKVELEGYPVFTMNIFKGRVTSVSDPKANNFRFRVYCRDVEIYLNCKKATITEVEKENI